MFSSAIRAALEFTATRASDEEGQAIRLTKALSTKDPQNPTLPIGNCRGLFGPSGIHSGMMGPLGVWGLRAPQHPLRAENQELPISWSPMRVSKNQGPYYGIV